MLPSSVDATPNANDLFSIQVAGTRLMCSAMFVLVVGGNRSVKTG